MDERLVILGTGAIGLGLVRLGARLDPVTLWARSSASADIARAKLAGFAESVEGALAEVTVTTDLQELQSGSFIIEAVTEDQGTKTALLRSVGEVVDDAAVVATTTSSLSVTELGRDAGLSGRFIGFHPFNPVHKMPLVELIHPQGTDDATRLRARAMCEALNKTAIEVPDVPGFVVNRLLFPYLFAAVRLLDDTGLEADEVDACMVNGAGMPLGPLALLDLVGLDVAVAIGESLDEPIPERVLDMVAQGRLGRKSGHGFHRHEGKARVPGG